MNDVDVLVVGLGPTGATLAALLGQRGVRVAAFDRLPGLYPLPRAIGIDHEAMRIAQELGIAERLREHLGTYRPSEYRGVDGEPIKRLDAIPQPYPLGWAPNYVFDQPGLEGILRERLSELPSVQVHLAAEVVDCGEAEGRAWAEVKLAGAAAPTRFTGRYVIACDGGGSPMRKRLGLELEDLGFHEPWLVVDVIVPDAKSAQLPQTQVQYCEPERPATFVVGPGNHRRWEIMLLPGDSLSPQFPDAELWPLLRRWIQPGEAKLWRAAAYTFHGLVAHRWRSGRFFLAGDAAHMTPPFMAQGMVQGMRDAANLAWKLDRVLKGSAPARLLDTYEAERKPHVTHTTRIAIELGKVICERDPAAARARDARLRQEQGGTIKTQIRQHMIPGLSAGLCDFDTPAAGTLFPQPTVRGRSASRLLDEVTGAGVRLVVLGPVDEGRKSEYRRALAAVDGVLVELAGTETGAQDAIEEDPPILRNWLRGLEACAVLVRPDHYVYGTARSHDQALALVAKLREGLAPTSQQETRC
jgi:3-(3-hydroxy-phenyl)propionate hydroxylase